MYVQTKLLPSNMEIHRSCVKKKLRYHFVISFFVLFPYFFFVLTYSPPNRYWVRRLRRVRIVNGFVVSFSSS